MSSVYEEVLDLADELMTQDAGLTFADAKQAAASFIADLLADPDLHAPLWPEVLQ